MEILQNIPAPPLPGGALGMSIAVGAMVAGLALLLVGHLGLWRILPAGAAAFAAYPGGNYLAAKTGCNPLPAAVGLSAVGGLVGLLAARLAWILAFATLLSGLLIAGLAELYARQGAAMPDGFEAVESLQQWQEAVIPALQQRWQWLITSHRKEISLAIAASLTMGLLLGTHKPVIARILCMTLAGAILLVAGGCYVILAVVVDADLNAGYRPILIAAVTVAAFLIGAIRQWRSERRMEAQHKAVRAEQEAKAKKEKSAGSDKPNKA